MQTSEILRAIDEEIGRLRQVRNLLSGNGYTPAMRGPKPSAAGATGFSFSLGKSTVPRKRRRLSAAGRARIAAAQKARWAKVKKASAERNGKK